MPVSNETDILTKIILKKTILFRFLLPVLVPG